MRLNKNENTVCKSYILKIKMTHSLLKESQVIPQIQMFVKSVWSINIHIIYYYQDISAIYYEYYSLICKKNTW